MDPEAQASAGLESRATAVAGSLIRELANAAMQRPELIPLWFGESDRPTPAFIGEAAAAAMRSGETFYTEGLGRPFLREAIARYSSDLYRVAVGSERIAVTVSGLNALNLALQSVLEQGDRVLTTLPTWPNLRSVPALQGARVETLPLTVGANGWSLDLERFLERAEGVKAVLLNSPNNPTGWMMSSEEQRALLEVLRRRGTWLISDEVYARLCFSGRAAPSFLEVAEPEDRLIVVNSFSKAWAMTGWRLGWLTLPPSLLPLVEKIAEYSVSCAPAFVQRAGVVALEQGEPFVAAQVAGLRRSLDLTASRLAESSRITFPRPQATFYAYFRIEGVPDGVAFARRLIAEADVGIAPGQAFDPKARDWFRICFARSDEVLDEALARLLAFIR